MSFSCVMPKGKALGLAMVSRNITDRKRAEDQLRELTTQLERRVEERTRLLAESQERLRALATELTLTEHREHRRMATELHDYLAQLLVVARMKLGHLRQRGRDTKLSEEVGEIGEVIQRSLAYTRSLVVQLSPPVLHEFGLVAALRSLAEQMESQGLNVTVEAAPQALTIPQDQAILLYQSVRELLYNVIKHAGVDAATVSVSVTADGRPLLAVADQGRGFDAAHAMRLESESSKFGLFSIRERMTVLGGQFDSESRPGLGTRMTLTMPLPDVRPLDGHPSASAQTAWSATQAVGSVDARRRHGTLRVLLADDHAMVREGLRNILQAYEDVEIVGEAGDGKQAVELARSLLPDVVVMDVNMPVMDGIEATRLIKQVHPRLAVIGLSVRSDRETSQAMQAAGASRYLSKESVGQHLYETIRQVVYEGSPR